MPAMVRPRPTWVAFKPTSWVKNTALPVLKVPSPSANKADWVASLRESGVGGISRLIVALVSTAVSDHVRPVRVILITATVGA